MYKQFYIISYTDIFLHLGNLEHVSSSAFTCPLDDVSRLLILSSKSLIACFDSWASFSYSFPKSAFCTLWKQDIALSYTENSNVILYKMKAYKLVQQQDTYQKPFSRLK
jgi:hypothetical protein